jgi:glycosyltransferase involved in cell wall biosynthesis
MPVLPGKPLVSIILPSFNHAAFVHEAVTSVLDQSFRDLELVVVDDGSSDGTADIVASIHDPRLTLIRLSENRAVHARNLALGRAAGQYIAFQNSDDIWLPSKLGDQLEVMERRAGRYTAGFTAVRIVDEKGMATSNTWASGLFTTVNRTSAEWLRQFLDFGNCLPLPSAIVRRTDLNSLRGFRASLVQLGDFDLWIRLAALGEFFILPDPLTKVRVIPGVNLSQPTLRGSRRARIELATVLERYAEPSILAKFDGIFPDSPKMPTAAAKKVALALYVWNRGPGYSLFADRVVERVIEDACERADAVATHGAGFIHAFLNRRCESELVLHGANSRCDERETRGILARCRRMLGW